MGTLARPALAGNEENGQECPSSGFTSSCHSTYFTTLGRGFADLGLAALKSSPTRVASVAAI